MWLSQCYACPDTRTNSLQWDQGKIIKFGWTTDERLVVLNEEGVYRLYDLQGDYQQYSLGSEAAETGVIDARIHEQGLVALTSSLTLLEVKGWEGGKPLTLSNPGWWSFHRNLHYYLVNGRSHATTTLLGCHPAGSDHLTARRGASISGFNSIQCR